MRLSIGLIGTASSEPLVPFLFCAGPDFFGSGCIDVEPAHFESGFPIKRVWVKSKVASRLPVQYSLAPSTRCCGSSGTSPLVRIVKDAASNG